LFQIPTASIATMQRMHAGCEQMRRARSRQRNIGAELRAPVEKALILETGQTGTDAELAHLAAPAAPRTVLPMIIFRAISRMRLDFAFKLDYRLCLTGQQCSRWESCDGTAAPLCCLRRRPGAIRKVLCGSFRLEQVTARTST
jgi:hypothetical protein